MEKLVRVSVVMTVFNASKYLEIAINSILNQTYSNFEFIIVNDFSSDNSINILNEFKLKDSRIRVIDNTMNLGVSKSCNKAISYSKGEIIIRMDSDDIAKVNRIEKLVNFLDENKDVIVVGSNVDVIDMAGNYIYTTDLPLSHLDICKSLEKRATFVNPSTAFRKESFFRVNGYYEPIKHYFEDFILWAQLSKIGKLAILNESLLEYRIVMNSISTKSVSKEYKLLERKIAHKGFATDEEMMFILNEKKNQSLDINSELSYYLILAEKYLFNNYSLKDAKKYLENAKKINPNSKKLKLLIVCSYFPRYILKLIIKLKNNVGK